MIKLDDNTAKKQLKKKLYLFFISSIIIIVYNSQINKNYIEEKKLELLLLEIRKKIFILAISQYKTVKTYIYCIIKTLILKNTIINRKNWYLVSIIS